MRNIISTNLNDSDYYCIGIIARQDKPIDYNVDINEVNDIFSNESTLQGIPVVKDKKALGVIMRSKFYLQFFKNRNRTNSNLLFRNVMTKLPIIVDYYSPIRKVIEMFIQRSEQATYDYIIVTKDGEYYGVVSVISMMDIMLKYKI